MNFSSAVARVALILICGKIVWAENLIKDVNNDARLAYPSTAHERWNLSSAGKGDSCLTVCAVPALPMPYGTAGARCNAI